MPTHPFYVPQKGWTEAAKLRAGDILVTCNGEYVVIEQVQHELLETPITVYNFEVEDFHTYYVAANEDAEFVLVHNKCGGKYDPQRKGTPRNNRAQNKAFDAAMREARITDKDTIRQIHDEISKQNYNYHEIVELAKTFVKHNNLDR